LKRANLRFFSGFIRILG